MNTKLKLTLFQSSISLLASIIWTSCAFAQSGYQIINGTRVLSEVNVAEGYARFSNACGSQILTQRQLEAGAIPNEIIPCPRPQQRRPLQNNSPAKATPDLNSYDYAGMRAALKKVVGGERTCDDLQLGSSACYDGIVRPIYPYYFDTRFPEDAKAITDRIEAKTKQLSASENFSSDANKQNECQNLRQESGACFARAVLSESLPEPGFGGATSGQAGAFRACFNLYCEAMRKASCNVSKTCLAGTPGASPAVKCGPGQHRLFPAEGGVICQDNVDSSASPRGNSESTITGR